jgi:hypothetical protein
MWVGCDARLRILSLHLIQINDPCPHRLHWLPTNSGRSGVLQEQEALELMPWDRATVSGYYLLLNVFSTPTGERVFVERGGLMPSTPRPHSGD